MLRIKQGDEVVISTGKDKGKRGKVTKLVGDDKVMVEGLNVVKKHQKPNPQAGVPGGIIEKSMAIHISNVMLYNAASEKGDRVGFKVLEDGKKVRVFKSNGEVVKS